jgi:DNA replication protein
MSDRIITEWGGFFITPNIIIDDYGANLGVYGLAVYMTLARYANQNGESFPAVKTIATVCDCSENKVREAIKHLVRLGLLRVEERSKDSGGQTSNLYTLLTPPTRQVKPPPSQDEAPPLHTVNPNKTHSEQDSSNKSSSSSESSKTKIAAEEPKAAATAEDKAKLQKVVKLYEENLGVITPLTHDLLIEMADKYALAHIEFAMTEAVKANVRKLNYVQGILDRIEREGFNAAKRPPDRRNIPGTIPPDRRHNKDIIEATPEQLAGVGVPITPEKMEEIRERARRQLQNNVSKSSNR